MPTCAHQQLSANHFELDDFAAVTDAINASNVIKNHSTKGTHMNKQNRK